MLLKLKESIITGGEHYSPTTVTPPHPAGVIDTHALKIRDTEAEVLVRRGTAVHYTPEQAEPEVPAGGPVVTHIQTIQQTDASDEGAGAGADADLVEGRLAGIDEMTKPELVALAKEMGLETAGKTKPELIAAIKAEPVFAKKTEVEGEGQPAGEGADAGAGEGGDTGGTQG